MINWNRVQELKDEIGEEDFAEVAEMFVAEIEEVVARLQFSPDPTQYEADLHFIKSSSLNVGFADLSALCQIGERMARDGQAQAVDLAPILACFEASKAAFVAG